MQSRNITAVFTCLALASGAAPATLAAQNAFEGTIVFLLSQDEGSTPDTMIQTTKGQNLRLDGGNREKFSLIFDGAGHRMLMVQPAEKKYFVMTEAEMQMMHARTEALMKQYNKKGEEDEDDSGVQFSNTGRTETVAGAKCQVWRATTVQDGKKNEGEACIANGVGFAGLSTMWNNPMMQAGGKETRMMATYKKLVGPNKGVLKIVEFKDGKPRTAMEAVSISRAAVPDAAFQPPAGYTAVNLGQMMQGMQKKGTESSAH